MHALYLAESKTLAVSGTSAAFSLALASDQRYSLICTVDCFVTQAASAAVATTGDGSRFVPAKTELILNGQFGASVAVILSTGSGIATLTRCRSFG